MPILEPQLLWQEAQEKDRKLTPSERRRVVMWLQHSHPELFNTDIARVLGVSDKLIRNDKELIRKKAAEEIKNDSIELIISDIIQVYNKQAQDLERSKRKAVLGKGEYRMHSLAVAQIENMKLKALQDVGWIPKNLGTGFTESYSYVVDVGENGMIKTQKVEQKMEKKSKIPNKYLPQLDSVTKIISSEPTKENTSKDKNEEKFIFQAVIGDDGAKQTS